MRIRIRAGADGQSYVRFQAANGEPWYTSEGYVSAANAERSAFAFVEAICTQFGGTAPDRAAVEAAIIRE